MSGMYPQDGPPAGAPPSGAPPGGFPGGPPLPGALPGASPVLPPGVNTGVPTPTIDLSWQLAHFIILMVFSLFASLAVGLRFWARKIQSQRLAISDCLLFLGLVRHPMMKLLIPDF